MNLFRCRRCGITLIDEEFDYHKCSPNLKDVRVNQYDYYFTTKDNVGNESIIIKGMDGILYQFTKRGHLETDKVPISDEMLQGYKIGISDKDVTESSFGFCSVSVCLLTSPRL